LQYIWYEVDETVQLSTSIAISAWRAVQCVREGAWQHGTGEEWLAGAAVCDNRRSAVSLHRCDWSRRTTTAWTQRLRPHQQARQVRISNTLDQNEPIISRLYMYIGPETLCFRVVRPSVRVCVRVCVPMWRHSTTGLLSTSSLAYMTSADQYSVFAFGIDVTVWIGRNKGLHTPLDAGSVDVVALILLLFLLKVW